MSCKEWTRAKSKKGYGVKWFNGKLWSVHRLTWFKAHGPIPPGKMVLHKCDNRKCYELEHLFLGTAKDNTDDMMRKGRHVAKRKFTDEQLAATSGTQRERAEKLGVSQSAISRRLA